MNRQVMESIDSFGHPNEQSTVSWFLPQLWTTCVLLAIAYYVIDYSGHSISPDTIKRLIIKASVYLTPSPAIFALQAILQRYRFLSDDIEDSFKRSDFGDQQAKAAALGRLLHSSRLPNALRKVSIMSGFDPVMSGTKPPGPPGLRNRKTECFHNSVLQALASLPAFMAYVKKSSTLCEDLEVQAPIHAALHSLLEYLADTSQTQQYTITPPALEFLDCWQQQDAEEYFSQLMSLLANEDAEVFKSLKRRTTNGLKYPTTGVLASGPELLKHVSNLQPPQSMPVIESSNSLSVEDVILQASMPRTSLTGMTAQILECLTCQNSDGYTLTEFNYLPLVLGDRVRETDIHELMWEFTKAERVEGVECDDCTRRAAGGTVQSDGLDADKRSAPTREKLKAVRRDKRKSVTVARLPKNLIFHINRSQYDDCGNRHKNPCRVMYPDRLSFEAEWCPYAATGDSDQVQRVYELKSVLCHYGRRHDDGHYYSYSKRGEEWYCCDDEDVYRIRLEDVLFRNNAFMLFYEAVDSSDARWPTPAGATAAEAGTEIQCGTVNEVVKRDIELEDGEIEEDDARRSEKSAVDAEESGPQQSAEQPVDEATVTAKPAEDSTDSETAGETTDTEVTSPEESGDEEAAAAAAEQVKPAETVATVRIVPSQLSA